MDLKQLFLRIQHSPSMELNTFRWLLTFAIICFILIWMIDESSGLISEFDAVSYPICIGFFSLIYLWSLSQKSRLEYLYLFTYFIIAGYLTSSSIFHHFGLNGMFSNAAQWLGLNYVMAYLFLDVSKAALTSIIVFIITLIGHYIVLIIQFPLKDTLGILFNMGVAHLVYMVLLWTVLRMRVRAAKIHERLGLLEHYALLDPLTQVFNRRGLEKVLHQAEQEHQLRGGEYAIVLIDIDHFKNINDRYGHLVGDWVLKECITILSQIAGANDQLGRWGGEEFVMLTQNQSRQEIFAYAERMRLAVNRGILMPEGEMVSVSIGIGYSGEGRSSRDIFDTADRNLYIAKNRGRNQVMDTSLADSLSDYKYRYDNVP